MKESIAKIWEKTDPRVPPPKDLVDFTSGVRPHVVLEAACELFNVTPKELRGTLRTKHIVMARRHAMHYMRHHMKMTFPHIGSVFSRDHTSVIAAVRKADTEHNECTKMNLLVQAIMDRESP